MSSLGRWSPERRCGWPRTPPRGTARNSRRRPRPAAGRRRARSRGSARTASRSLRPGRRGRRLRRRRWRRSRRWAGSRRVVTGTRGAPAECLALSLRVATRDPPTPHVGTDGGGVRRIARGRIAGVTRGGAVSSLVVPSEAARGRSTMKDEREVVVVTGASGGVGRATARRFAADGARLALIARGRNGLEATAREVEELGGEALVLPVDVADPDQVEAAASSVEDAFGPIDVWVNDAMVDRLRRVPRHRAGRVQARHRGHLPRHGVGHARRAEAHVAARPRLRSCRSARRCPTAASRCSRPTAAPSTRARGSRRA